MHQRRGQPAAIKQSTGSHHLDLLSRESRACASNQINHLGDQDTERNISRVSTSLAPLCDYTIDPNIDGFLS